MAEPFDEYADQFTMQASPYGVSLNFLRSSRRPVAPGSNVPSDDIGSIRMSFEHYKLMIFLMKRQMEELEGQLGIEVPVSRILMNQLKIAPEDWQKFWSK